MSLCLDGQRNAGNVFFEAPKNTFGFPYEPYPIQEQLMKAIFQAIDERKVGIFESPTGTGKSLSTICASLSWLKQMQQKQRQEIAEQTHQLEQKIKEADADDDWMNAHGRKLEAQKELSDVEFSNEHLAKIQQRIEKANAKCKERKQYRKLFFGAGKRKGNSDDLNEDEALDALLTPTTQKNEEDADLIPEDLELDSKDETESREPKEEPLKTGQNKFSSRTVTVGSRQVLCINDQVRALKIGGLVNDRCNELLNTKTTTGDNGKRSRDESGSMIKKLAKKCGCEFAKSDAIEDLADEILIRNHQQHSSITNVVSGVTEVGRELNACPYFSTRQAMPLCELVLVPYNILLHKSTREAWNLDLNDNVVIIDEAHNYITNSIWNSQLRVG
uniref:Helicase ATP-binding domain-containing protein n=2 Tax=Ditylenchus dipsaci TaxID=166011 RepID=A0A915ENY2_9BILA